MRILRRIVGAGVLLLTVGAVVGSWAYYEWMAPTVAGTVVDKQQRIIGARHAAPGRYLSTSFRLVNETEEDRYLYGSPLTTDIPVDQDTYDAHRAGASVRVKYLPFNPRTARLVGQPLVPQSLLMLIAAAVIAVCALLLTRTRMAVAVGVLFTAAILYSTPGPPSPRLALTAAVALAAVAVVAAIARRGSARIWLAVWAVASAALIIVPGLRDGAANTLAATADVRDVREFRTPTGSRARSRLITMQEFERVHAAFVPEGETQPVFLLDFVDLGTVPGLADGAKVAVQYNRDRPDAARLVQGERTHYWKNAAIPVGVVLVFGWLATRGRKTGKRQRTKIAGRVTVGR